MFQNYLKIAFRNLLKHKRYSLINILGLSVAIAYSIVAYLNYDYNASFNQNYENADEIYRVKTIKLQNGKEQKWAIAPRPLAEALVQDFPAIENAVRITMADAVFRRGESVFNEEVVHADPALVEMFDVPIKFGNPEVLYQKNQLIISEDLAVKYFGDENPLGKIIRVRYFDGINREFRIGAVAGEIPDNSSIQFDALTNLDVLVDTGIDAANDWGIWSQAVFVQTKHPEQLPDIAGQLDRYIAAHNAVSPEWEIGRFYFEPLSSIGYSAWETRGDMLQRTMHPAGRISPVIIAVLLLLMACFNYINTSIAFSVNRLKEIGVRKVIGGLRTQLILQFLGENLLLCIIALFLGMGLAEIFVPVHDSMWPYFELTLDYSENQSLLLFLAGLLLALGGIAGGYPAFYISAYKPVAIFRGKQQFGSTSWLSRILLTFQFSISILTIIASLIFVRNADFLKNIDLGYEKEMVLGIHLKNSKYYQPLHDALEDNTAILDIAGTWHHLGFNMSRPMVKSESQEKEAVTMSVGYDYLETMEVQFAEGRSFDENLATDEQAVIINQKFAKEFGWQRETDGQRESPLGKTITIGEKRYTVIGVVEDFYTDGVFHPIPPSVFRITKPENFIYLVARVHPENLIAVSELLRKEWRKVAPDAPYGGFFQEEAMAEAVMISESIKKMFVYIALMAIAISMMGFFALVSLNIARRTKEIGIRKVLGASMFQIVRLVNKEFLLLLTAATLIASVVGAFSVEAILKSIYEYHVAFSIIPFVMAGAIVFFVGIITVGSQVYKVATSNPVDSLRYE